MREISVKAKRQVITLFFSGLSYDQISRESGVSKGGVVNIIDDYREGRLVVSGDILLDLLLRRDLVVSCRKEVAKELFDGCSRQDVDRRLPTMLTRVLPKHRGDLDVRRHT